jgi:hypothetical protein
MSIPKFSRVGKVVVTVLRSNGGSYINGRWQGSTPTPVSVTANIQPNLTFNQMRTLSEGDRTKQAIAIYSKEELFMAEEGTTSPKKADIVNWDGKQWEVKSSMTYKMGVLNHCESVAVRLDDA